MIFEYKLIRVKDIYMGQGVFHLLRPVDYLKLEDFADAIRAKVEKGRSLVSFDPPVVVHTERGFGTLAGWDKVEWARRTLEPELYAIVAEPEELPA